MTRTTAQSLAAPESTTSPTLLDLLPRFHRHPAAENKAAKTITSYTEAKTRYAPLRQFFRWAVKDREITESPMSQLSPPHVPEQPVPVLSDDELQALLRIADRDGEFLGRRDGSPSGVIDHE